MLLRLLPLICMLLLASPVQAGRVHVAVAANFTQAAKEISRAFSEKSGHHSVVSYGSTGKLYTQIIYGAPFQIFLAADAVRPERLEKEGKSVPGRRFTYAIGKLALWSKEPDRISDSPSALKGSFRRLALANPKTAPYGAAALEVLQELGLDKQLRSKMIRGDNVAQTYQFVATGNAQLGFVALAQVKSRGGGSHWEIPQSMYTPIKQQVVLLKKGQGVAAAEAFMAFLRGAEAQAIMKKFGYGVE
uniref:Molybdenum ABC transporter (Substrate-binding protein) n=1 Tax=Magnetococcus massalia (strain MO-1) TaxID=451514 RepID=A0A1S7LFJ3_MAGMO|nr:molybdenum ABC transporter (substrate-binding protein) [Candidatus Magnetococcus massalia]